MQSIRYKATAITIAEILTAILCVYLASFSIIQADNDRRSVEMMDLLAHDTGLSLEEYATGIARSVDMVSNLATDTLDSVILARCGAIGMTAEQRSPEQQAQLDAYLDDYVHRIQLEFAAVAEHTYGVATYHFTIDPSISSDVRGFYYSHVGRTGFYEREPFDPRTLDRDDPDHSSWYFTPIERGRPSWVGPFPATSLDELLICAYIVPIYKSGTLIGTLGMDIPLDTLVTLVSSIEVYDTGFACLLNEDGSVIYHPEMEYGDSLDLPIDRGVFHQEDSAGMLIRYTSATGERRQTSFTTLSTGMKLLVVAPTDEVNASARRLASATVLIAVAVVLAISLLSMLAIGRLTQPLQDLTSAAQRLADGDFDVELDYRPNDEVGALTTAFRRMRTQIEGSIEDLNRRVHTDDLTGLPNQRSFFELAQVERDRLLARGKDPVILYFNLLGIKYFNQRYGFAEGDRLICEVADILSRHFGEQLVSRFAQDHFVVVSDEDGLEERLQEVFVACQQAHGGESLPVSVGVYQHSVGDVEVSVACDRAKFACDQRRGSYVSGVSYFEMGMRNQINTIRYVISHLDEALEKEWVQVYYQPIVRAVNGRVCDEEALCRWIDPEQGYLSPADVIPALEGTGLIYRLDLYVLEKVLEKMQLQERLGLAVVPHSINLSRSDFESCDVVEEIRRRVDEAGIARNMITIEITESIIGKDFDFMKEQVRRFRALGFPVWMDDFGSGYSSLDVLQSIEFDLIKFDMSFMRKLGDGESGKVILTELMRMATALGVDTICEGVESEEQVKFLREIGCSKLQGFYYCRAIPLDEIVDRNQQGIQIGYENPDESDYFEGVGRINLHDLTAIALEGDDTLQNAFNTVPMAVLELAGDTMQFVRTNQAYRDYMKRYFWMDVSDAPAAPSSTLLSAESYFLGRAKECCEQKGSRLFFDQTLPDGSTARCLMRYIQTNPVTGTMAIVVAVLSIT